MTVAELAAIVTGEIGVGGCAAVALSTLDIAFAPKRTTLTQIYSHAYLDLIEGSYILPRSRKLVYVILALATLSVLPVGDIRSFREGGNS